MSPQRPPPRPASRDWPGVMSLSPASRDCATAGGNAVHSSEASAFPALGKNRLREAPANTGPRFSGLSPAQPSVLSQLHSAARRRGFPETSHPSSRIRPSSEAALSADIRADFPPKNVGPPQGVLFFLCPQRNSRRRAKRLPQEPVFPPPAYPHARRAA